MFEGVPPNISVKIILCSDSIKLFEILFEYVSNSLEFSSILIVKIFLFIALSSINSTDDFNSTHKFP